VHSESSSGQIQLAAMKLLHKNMQIFKKLVTDSAVDFAKIGIDLSDSKNSEL